MCIAGYFLKFSFKQPHLNGQDVSARESRAKDNGVQSNGYPDGVQIERDLLSTL